MVSSSDQTAAKATSKTQVRDCCSGETSDVLVRVHHHSGEST